MAAKPVQFRDLANVDLDLAADYYVANADVAVALRFVDAVEAASRRVGKNPALGSPRFAYELSIPSLRAMPVDRFPYVLFYIEREDVVDVWRMLHTGRDTPATLQDSDG